MVSRLNAKLGRKAVRRRIIRIGFVVLNVVLLGVVTLFVLGNRSTGTSSHSLLSSGTTQTVSNPLDQLSSADIAVTVARMDSLAEISGVTSQANSNHAQLASATTSTNDVAEKPQVAASAFKSNKDIQTYVTQAGDTLASVAAKFGVTSDSVKWSNGLSSTINAGSKLLIPPVSGIVYTVKSGDTPDSLATTYKANKDEITAANDAEISGLHVGEVIIIPNGQQPAPVYSYAASSGFAWGTTAIYGSNGYDYGYCTWYVASRISVPSNWGNANTWSNYAAVTPGWVVSTTPQVGAIAQTSRGAEGHVAVVEQVSADGQQIIFSDMNGLAGWGRVGTSGWVSSSTFQHYISRG